MLPKYCKIRGLAEITLASTHACFPDIYGHLATLTLACTLACFKEGIVIFELKFSDL
jgi:hypothetical protein